MKAGDKARITCNECKIESEVVLEPKAIGLPKEELANWNEDDVTYCAFCGSDSIEVEE
jgi:hypothetical protein